jgi:hypothetical protein
MTPVYKKIEKTLSLFQVSTALHDVKCRLFRFILQLTPCKEILGKILGTL